MNQEYHSNVSLFTSQGDNKCASAEKADAKFLGLVIFREFQA